MTRLLWTLASAWERTFLVKGEGMAFNREPEMSLVGRLQREARFLPCVAITGRSLTGC